MSRLETAVIPVLSPLILGQMRLLTPNDLRVLALWAIKTHMAQELAASPAFVLTPQEQRSWMVKERPEPPPGIHVWIGTFDAPVIGGHYDCSPLSLPGAGAGVVAHLDREGAYDLFGGYRATLIVGHLVMSVVYMYGNPNREISYSRLLPIVRIWPPASLGLLWPAVQAKFTPPTIEAFKEENLVLTPFHA